MKKTMREKMVAAPTRWTKEGVLDDEAEAAFTGLVIFSLAVSVTVKSADNTNTIIEPVLER